MRPQNHNRISSIDGTLRRRPSVDQGYSSLNGPLHKSLPASTSQIPQSRKLSRLVVLSALGCTVLLYLGWSQTDYAGQALRNSKALSLVHLTSKSNSCSEFCSLEQWAYAGKWSFTGRALQAKTWQDLYLSSPQLSEWPGRLEDAPPRGTSCLPSSGTKIDDKEKEARMFARDKQAHNWAYAPPDSICRMAELDDPKLVESLVKDGSWTFIGDSISSHEFYSISSFMKSATWQTAGHLSKNTMQRRLREAHPMFESMKTLPGGTERPLIQHIFSRFLLSKEESAELFPDHLNNLTEKQTKSWDSVFTPDLEPILESLGKDLGQKAIIINTGAWHSGALGDGFDSTADQHLNVYQHLASKALDLAAKHLRKDQVVFVRGTAAAHEGCKDYTKPMFLLPNPPALYGPYSDAGKSTHNNWVSFSNQNALWKYEIERIKWSASAATSPSIYYLDPFQSTWQRPDAHCSDGDCLHWIIGSGIIESWTEAYWTQLQALKCNR